MKKITVLGLVLLILLPVCAHSQSAILQKLAMGKWDQTISWGSQPSAMTVGDADQTLNQASSTSGLTITYSTDTTSYCTVVAGPKLHAVAAGTCVVHADVADSRGFYAATRVDSGNITISAGGGGTITRVGYGNFEMSTNTGTANISVPATAKIVIIYVTGWVSGADNYFTGGALTIGGAATVELTGGNASAGTFMGAGFYKLSPSTGTVAVAWDWSGTSDVSSGGLAVWVAYDTVTSVRSSAGNQSSGLQYNTGSLTSTSGDMISVAAFGYMDSEATVTTWSNATEIGEFTGINSGDITLAEHASTGNVTIATTAAVNYQDGGMLWVIMTP